MLAFKFTYGDILEGMQFKAFRVLDPATMTPCGAFKCKNTEPDPTLDELRRHTGTKDIYAVLEFRSLDNFIEYFNEHRQELIEMDARLAKDPDVQKSIADYEKDQKQFRIWQAAQKWDVN